MKFPTLLTVIDDNGVVVNSIFWLLLIIVIILFSIALLNIIRLCQTCCRLTNVVVIMPARQAYNAYKDFMNVPKAPDSVCFVV
ncbi:envelope protein [Ferret coronavirus]|uniref:Envelope small membrane protein n=1 Tax=Ferret coronavirus TaxID=1264898 RepID=A0A172B5K4_9ALPC|nr:envelope protein [Ferret coronavirus]AKG92642.1 envelope protein [Ferret coronavirus]